MCHEVSTCIKGLQKEFIPSHSIYVLYHLSTRFLFLQKMQWQVTISEAETRLLADTKFAITLSLNLWKLLFICFLKKLLSLACFLIAI